MTIPKNLLFSCANEIAKSDDEERNKENRKVILWQRCRPWGEISSSLAKTVFYDIEKKEIFSKKKKN